MFIDENFCLCKNMSLFVFRIVDIMEEVDKFVFLF